MFRLHRGARATCALVILASLGANVAVNAQGQDSRERQQQRWSMAQRRSAWRGSEAGLGRGTLPSRAQRIQAARRRAYARFADGGRRGDFRGPAAGGLRVVRYGRTDSGTVERMLGPGLLSRTFVSGGRVRYARVYRNHVWHHFGRAFAYERFVPAVRYPAVYYAWALARWSRPVTYAWAWQAQPWYPTYGPLFTPYPVYTRPDQWMTDYIIAQSLQAAYQAQSAALPPAAAPPPASAPPPVSAPPPAAVAVAPPPVPPAAPSTAPVAPPAPLIAPPAPPAITPQIKADLDAEIQVQLREQQAAAAAPTTPTTQSTPPALRPSHVFFQVVQPLSVPSGHQGYCSLSADDYIKRTGGMSSDNWQIPVVVELSGPADCPEGLRTRIGLNDLSAMENEQEAQVMQAMQAASKSMGSHGLPSGPGVHPTYIAEGSAAPDPGALDAIRQAQ
ncbi:MAG TPA: hypothetical protein VMD56_06785 [Steroidobacteraceae bacterium]|nr:hypothetical protein [Steroidobacteraceae bacterium]